MINFILSLLMVFSMAQEDIETPDHWNMDRVWNSCTDEQRMELDYHYLARACGMDPEEFLYMAQVIEAESDRSNNLQPKVMIAACIFNRVESSYFRDTVRGVLDEPGQFSTTSGGRCGMNSTQTSRWAIVEAQRQLRDDDIPHNVLFFNCIGYNNGTPYGVYGDNYFMTYGD